MKHEDLTLLIDIKCVCYKFTCMKSKQKILLGSKYTILIDLYPDCYFVHFPLSLPFPFSLPLPSLLPFTCPLTFCFFPRWIGFKNNRGWCLLFRLFLDESHDVLQPPKILFVCNAFFFPFFLLFP